MARIETYPLDGNISVNDYVIGTDGDSLNATKNYKVLTFLDYLGRLYNLNSTDLLFNYNNVAAGSVGDGEVSTNNYADGTILMSGVTNIYVSKTTAFGQLVDDIINTTGTENLSIMFTDMGNRNNLGIFTVDSTVDVDANTINMSVTASTTVGSISAGKVMGIRIGVGGGGTAPVTSVFGRTGVVVADSSDYAAHYAGLFGSNTLNGVNTFESRIQAEDGITFEVAPSVTSKTGAGTLTLLSGNQYVFKRSDNNNSVTLNLNSITTSRTLTAPDNSGTIALLSDIPSAVTISDTVYGAGWNGNTTDGASKNAIYDKIETLVTLSSAQTITGGKTFNSAATFTNGLTSNSLITISSTGWLNINSSNPHVAFAQDASASTTNASRPIIYWNSSEQFSFSKANSASRASLDIGSLTAHRVFTLPDKAMTFAGIDDIPTISDTAYDATSWNGNLDGASKNAIRDKIVSVEASIPTVPDLASQAEAEAGTENTKIMTPLRVQQAIDAYSDSGTFTPAVLANGTAGYTYTTQSGDYRKVGDIVHFDLLLSVSATSGTPSSGEFKITGLPFTKSNTRITPVNVYSTTGISITGLTALTGIIPSDDYIWITYLKSGGGAPFSVKNDEMASAFTIYVSGTYTTNS